MPQAAFDSFARDHLPPRDQWPDLLFDLPSLHYPARLNAVTTLLDDRVAHGHGDRPCLIAPGETLSYAQLQQRVNRIAQVLVREFGLIPGNRVLLRAANTPMMAACILAVIKAGGIAVPTMPLLRARELAYPIRKARIALALCDARLTGELEAARAQAPELRRILPFNSPAPEGLEARLHAAPARFTPADTAADDVCLIAFTSGTTGEPKGTMHVHRDLLACCDTYSRHVLCPTQDDRFIGSPPLAFTFGLGGLLLFPLHAGAATILLERTAPEDLLAGIAAHRASVCFTAPTAYRAMLGGLRTPTSPRCAAASRPARRCRWPPSRPGRRRPACASWTASAPPKCCTSSSARRRRHCAPAPPACPCRATRPAWWTMTATSCRTGRSAGSPCAGRRAAAISTIRGSEPTCSTAGTSPAMPICAMPTGISGTRRARTT